MDPLRPVRGGDRVRRSAATQNAILAAARAANTRDFGSSDGAERDEAQVLIKATAALARFAPFALGTVITTPATDSQFQRLPAFNSAAVTENNPFGIMLDPAAIDNVGRGLLVGMATAQVTISDAKHNFAKVNADLAIESAVTGYARIIWKAGTSGSQWCLLALPAVASGSTIPDPDPDPDPDSCPNQNIHPGDADYDGGVDDPADDTHPGDTTPSDDEDHPGDGEADSDDSDHPAAEDCYTTT